MRSAIFYARGEKGGFFYALSKILFAAKHSWTTLRMSRPLFVGSYFNLVPRGRDPFGQRRGPLGTRLAVIYEKEE